MKIIRLEILNLASLDRPGGEVINFDEGALGDSTIFSIVGPMGSGKSTLLDAICLALYGRAPRYPRKPGDRKQGIVVYGEKDNDEQNRPAPTDSVNILTRGKKNGYAKLTFKANNGNVYRAEWHVRFKTKEYDRPQTCLYLLTRENGLFKEEEARWEDIPSIVGLEYEQFLRTVLIAQGSFANFLTAKEDERYQLLEKLIGCEELYTTIASKIKEQKERAAEAYNAVAANMSAFEKDIIPDEELPELEKHIRELVEDEKRAKEEFAKVVESLGWYTAEEQYLLNLSKYESQLKQCQQDLEGMKADADLLKLHDETLPAVDVYRDIQKTQKAISSKEWQLKVLDGKLEAKQAEITEAGKALTSLKEAAARAEKALDDQKPHINKARTIKGELLNARKTLSEKENARKEAEKAYEKAKQAVCDNAKAIETARQTLNKAETELNNLTSTISEETKKKEDVASQACKALETEEQKLQCLDAEELQKADREANRQKADIVEAIKTRRTINENAANIKKTEEEIRQLTLRWRGIEKELRQLDTETLKTELETLQKSYTLMTSEDWTRHRTGLRDGQPCPLCGAVHHPYVSNESFAPVVSDMDALIREKKKQLDGLNKQSQQLSEEKNRNQGTIVEKDNSLRRLKADLGQQQNCWTLIRSQHPDWPDNVELLTNLQQQIDTRTKNARQALDSYHALDKETKRLRQLKEDAAKALSNYKERSAGELSKAQLRKTDADTRLQTEQAKTQNLSEQEQQKKQALETAVTLLRDAQADVTTKENAIKSEIGNKDPDAFESELATAKHQADEAVRKQEEEIGKLEKEKESLTGQKAATEEAKRSEAQHLSEKTTQLEDWLRHYNEQTTAPNEQTTAPLQLPRGGGSSVAEQEVSPFDQQQKVSPFDQQQEASPIDQQQEASPFGGGLEGALFSIVRISESDADWESIRRKHDKLTQAATAAKTTYQNEQRNHEAHLAKKPADDQSTLTVRQTQLQQRSNAELVECQARKKRHDDAKRQLGTLHDEIKQKAKQKEEWEEIVNAIGADGKTLRKIAQCYTLRFLIAHANDEIRKFNSRYELLQVKNSLGIRVIDHDRADDVRDTTSLSGGETFIVSLGLALGLSALSSKNVSFENLFIDEGFGTLDRDTLETVIDSLAMLQSSQGKKVGVISHTESMSRINTQIRIIRNGSTGSSHIEIYP